MPGPPTFHGTAKRPVRLRRRAAVGAVALGLASLLVIGGMASPSVAQAPTVVMTCTLSGDVTLLGGQITDFPSNEALLVFAVVVDGQGRARVFDGVPVSTDSTGAGSTPSTNFEPLPFRVGFAVYRDTNSNSRWDPSRDDTLYRGDGTVTTCPQAVTLSPK